jgi:hypothetical protein
MSLKAGKPKKYESSTGVEANMSDSMALDMVNAMKRIWNGVYGQDLPDEGETEREVMFAAIAQGVVKHLTARLGGAVTIDVNTEQTSGEVESENPDDVTVDTGSLGHTHTIESSEILVKQTSAAVESAGHGEIISVTAEDLVI